MYSSYTLLFSEFAENGKQNVTIFDLLTHRCNLSSSFTPISGINKITDMANIELVAKVVAGLAPNNKIGEVCAYQPIFIGMMNPTELIKMLGNEELTTVAKDGEDLLIIKGKIFIGFDDNKAQIKKILRK
jgi:Beta-lactamase.